MEDVLFALGTSLVLAFVVSGPKGRPAPKVDAPKAVKPSKPAKAAKTG